MLAVYFPENAISWKIHKITSFYVPCLVDELGTVELFTKEEGKTLHHLIKLESAQLSWVRNYSKRLQLIVEQHQQCVQADHFLLTPTRGVRGEQDNI